MDTNLKLFNKYSSEALEYEQNLESIVIDSKRAMETTTRFLKKIQGTIKEIKNIKDSLKRPHIDINKAIDSKYKEVIVPFEEIKNSVTSKQVEYQKKIEKERLKLEAEEKARFEEKQKALEKVNDKEITEIIENKHEEKKQRIDIAYSQAKQKGFYYDYEIKSADLFKVDKKYLNIKPLEIKIDIMKVKSDLKSGIEISHIEYEKVGKVK